MKNKNGKIIIVDDNSLNVDLLSATLEPLEYEIITYSNPQLALKELDNVKTDLVLIDVVMPELDGFVFAERFLKNHPNTPIIFISAHSAKENKIRGFNMGSFAYIEKPFDVNTTRAQIQSVLKLKKLQDELFMKKENLECIFEFSNNEIILTDLDFNILSQNNKLIKSKNKENNIVEIFKQNKQFEAISDLYNFVKTDEKQTAFRVIIDNKKYIKTNISKTFTDNVHSGYLIVMNDLTEEIKIEEQRDHFIETLTHDLKTPVRAEKRALELLYEGSFGELNVEQKDIIKEILNSSRYMMRMTDNILTRYKLENGKCKINKRSHSLKMILQDCLDNLKYLFENENQIVKIQTDIDDDVFDFDEREIKRALTNLIANASEYSPANSTIKICINKKNKNIELSVSDEGPGIPKEKLNAIFDDNTSIKSRFKKVGSGLGLFITKKIMEAHGGKINVVSHTGKGSKFTLIFPFEKTKSVKLSKY